MAEMIEAFQTNLIAMSLLAMLVGAFLIYNTMTFSVLRRRTLLATLRIVGVTRGSLFRLLLLEAALLGLVGTLLGLLLGTLTAHYLVQLVTRTINDLYFVLTVTRLLIEPLVLWKGTLVGRRRYPAGGRRRRHSRRPTRCRSAHCDVPSWSAAYTAGCPG